MTFSQKIASITSAALFLLTSTSVSGLNAHAATSPSPFQPYQIELTQNESLYTDHDPGSITSNQLAPQTVTVLSEAGRGFKQIQTWLGVRWMRPNVYNELTDDTYQLKIEAPIVYNGAHVVASIAPQNVHVLKKKFQFDETYWYLTRTYLIDTWLGPKWINADQAVDQIQPVVAATPDQTQIHLIWGAAVYSIPVDDPHGEPSTLDGPQTVTSFERWHNWFHVHTRNRGDQWLNLSYIFEAYFGDIVPVSIKVSVPDATQLYTQPLPDKATYAKLAAQTVSVKGTYGSWYLISTTFMGDAWIDGSDPRVKEIK